MFAEVTFRLVGGDNPLILIPAMVNGRGPYEFILDTGAGTSLVSKRLADQLSIESKGKHEGAGAGGSVQVELAYIDSLAVGGARHGAMPIAITAEVERVGAAVGAAIDGDLGYDFLRDFRVTVDYAKQRVRLVQGASDLTAQGPSSEVPFKVAGPLKPLVLVPVFVDGQGPFSFAVDTGASVTTVSPELANRLDLASEGPMEMTGAGGAVEATVARVRTLAVGGASVENLTVAVSDFLGSLGSVLGMHLDGIVGYSFLRRYRVTFDYPAGMLGLSRES